MQQTNQTTKPKNHKSNLPILVQSDQNGNAGNAWRYQPSNHLEMYRSTQNHFHLTMSIHRLWPKNRIKIEKNYYFGDILKKFGTDYNFVY